MNLFFVICHLFVFCHLMPKYTKKQVFASFALGLLVYLTWKMYDLHVLRKEIDIVLKTKKGESLFYTHAYDLLINGVRTTNGILAVDRRPYHGNTAASLYEDVASNVINTLIIGGQPFHISFHSKDAGFFYFKMRDICSVFPLPSCSFGMHIESRITQFVHALGINVLK